MRYEFHPEAERELYEAALRYESDVTGLGRRFGDELERVINIVLEHPEMGAWVDESLRHFVLRKISILHRVRDQRRHCLYRRRRPRKSRAGVLAT